MTLYDYPTDLIDTIAQTLIHGIMKHINRVMDEVSDDWTDDKLYYEEDEDGNMTNLDAWDVKPAESDSPLKKAPLLVYGRIESWSEVEDLSTYEIGPSYWERIKDDSEGYIVNSKTTEVQADGTWLADGTVNFNNYDNIHHNQWVSLIEDGEEVNHSFIDSIVGPHWIRLQDSLFYYPNQEYKIYPMKMASTFTSVGDTVLAFAIHGESIQQVERMGKALRSYFVADQGDRDLVQVQIERKDEGKVPATLKVQDVGDLIPSDYVLTDQEKQKGVNHRRDLRVTLRASEILHRYDPMLEEGNISIDVKQS